MANINTKRRLKEARKNKQHFHGTPCKTATNRKHQWEQFSGKKKDFAPPGATADSSVS